MLIKNLLISAIAATLLSTQLFALPPQVEADRLGLAAKTAMEAKDYKTAVEKLKAMQKLGVKLPDSFSYHYGTALLSMGDPDEALKMFDIYLSQGSTAKFYKEALEKYTLAEKRDVWLDKSTGLIWQNFEKTPKQVTYYEARDYCSDLTLAGHSDWRLPDTNELDSLATLGFYNHAIYGSNPYDPESFQKDLNEADAWYKANKYKQINGSFDDPALKSRGGYYWSSSENNFFHSGNVWTTNFVEGRCVGYYKKSDTQSVRCVRNSK